MRELIDIKEANCFYDDKLAIKDLSLKVLEGDSVAILGPNGSGKSTLLKVIAGLMPLSSGQYLFENTIIDANTAKNMVFVKSMHKKIGFLFQNVEHQLFCTSVYDEIAFGPRQIGLDVAEVEKRINDCLAMFGISHLVDRIPYHLSEGEKKKVALASVLALNPDILVMDEPFNGLDNNTKASLLAFIRDFLRSGKTVICALHDIRDVSDVFTRVVALSSANSVVFDGTSSNFDKINY